MDRILDTIKVGDWIKIVDSGVHKFERVNRASGIIVATDNYQFTRFGRTWPRPKLNIMAEPASKDEIERWLAMHS